MQKLLTASMLVLSLFCNAVAARSLSTIIPVLKGAYAPATGGCDVAAAAFIYIEDKELGANKTTGKVRSIRHDGNSYVLDVLWVEAGSDEADGDRDTVRIEVYDDRSFTFSNTTSEKTLMKWCS